MTYLPLTTQRNIHKEIRNFSKSSGNSLTLAFAVIARSEATWQSDPKGRHERSEVISLLTGIASPEYSGLATASPDCFALLAMTKKTELFEKFQKF